jgi:phage shock protein C
MKKLYRSKTNKIFAGIIGGLGEYFDIDPVLLRLLFLVFAAFVMGLPALFVYVIAIFIIPVKI